MRTPVTTYRLQVTEDFDLLEAAKTLTYLRELGVDWVYLSPLLASESGSSHGYDVSDHRAIDPSRGRASGLAALSSEARRLGMGVLVDIVPNHVGVAAPVGERVVVARAHPRPGAPPYASAFDIDWDFGGGRVRIPVVGDDDLVEDEGGVPRIRNLRVLGGELHYHDQRFPLAPGSAELGAREDPDAVHARQHYELVSWRRADADLNYRRFFAVNTLVAIRVQDPEWFDKSHTEIVPVVRRGPGRRVARGPPRRPARPGRLPRVARRRDRRRLRPGREDPRARRGAADDVAHRRHHRVRRAGARHRLLTDPAGESLLDRPRHPAAGRRAGLARARARQQARGRRRDPALRGAADRARTRPPARRCPRPARP